MVFFLFIVGISAQYGGTIFEWLPLHARREQLTGQSLTAFSEIITEYQFNSFVFDTRPSPFCHGVAAAEIE